jgi:cell wall-associated NlpC family hydrolase
MDRFSRHRSLRVLGVATAIAACLLSAQARPAAADPTLHGTKQQYAEVQQEVRRLDDRAELLTEQYNAAVERLRQLKVQIRVTQRRLVAAQIKLRKDQNALDQLMVYAYKGLDPATFDIVLGARSLDDVTSGLDLKARYDQAVADAVLGVRASRDEIRAEKRALEEDQRQARRQRDILIQRRKEITKQLRRRRWLMASLGTQVRAGEAADRIGQADLAVKVAAWITADRTMNRNDPGTVLRDTIALEGLQQIGVPYKWGGASPETGFDCSGLIMWLWAKHGYSLPHFAASQYAMGPHLAPGEPLRIGDLVFFHDLGHVGMYVGNGYVLHAPHTGDFVRIAPFDLAWFQQTYVGATRPGPPALS